MTPTQLLAFEARMADRAAVEAKQAINSGTKPCYVPPKRVQPPMPATGARPCKACHSTGLVASRTCPSCLGAGWKWLPGGGATV